MYNGTTKEEGNIGRNIESFLIKVELGEMLGDAGALSLGKPAVSFGQAFRFFFYSFLHFLPIINISLGKPVVSFGPGFRIVSLSYRLQYCHHFIKNQLIVDPPHYTPRGKKDFFDNFEGEILELKKKRLR